MSIENYLKTLNCRTGRNLKIVNIASLFLEKVNPSKTPKFHQIVGDYLIFLAPIFQEINQKSVQFASEGYEKQGSRMLYHRTNIIQVHLRQALEEPHKNTFILVIE